MISGLTHTCSRLRARAHSHSPAPTPAHTPTFLFTHTCAHPRAHAPHTQLFDVIQGVDLSVQVVPSSVLVGNSRVSVSYSVWNNGTSASLARLWYDALVLSLDDEYSPSVDFLLFPSREHSGALEPGGHYDVVGFTAQIPRALTAQRAYVYRPTLCYTVFPLCSTIWSTLLRSLLFSASLSFTFSPASDVYLSVLLFFRSVPVVCCAPLCSRGALCPALHHYALL